LFTFKIYDGQNNPVPGDFDSIQIAQGKYSVAGQMLPEDLSLVKDDLNTGDTKLEPIFARNSVLPANNKKTVEANKTIPHDSIDEIRIMVVEGLSENHFSGNKPAGYLAIPGKRLKRDLLRGTEIDLTFEISESRDLTVQAYVNPSGPQFSQVFTPTYRDVPVEALNDEVQMLGKWLEQEKTEALANENYEVVESLEKLRGPSQELRDEALRLTLDDVTADRYKLENRKRKIAQELNHLTGGKRLERLRLEYQTAKDEVTAIVKESGNDHERLQLHEIVVQEYTFRNSTNPKKLEAAIDQIYHIAVPILRRTPSFLVGWFEDLVGRREMLNDQLQAKILIEAGKKHIAADDYDKLADVNDRLQSLLPEREREKDSKVMQHFTGII